MVCLKRYQIEQMLLLLETEETKKQRSLCPSTY